ncbi:DUF4262 domain-containing protein [Streptomyces sp. SID3343]|uniref:DUF4262 domain-containing protein n=1 Tax=Streptomyces sp. SID3343 TaxID=2690260 RepID=UPI001F46318C|nr:DUF4262 domain-containing protein [Streptomyces sp. SID3343]
MRSDLPECRCITCHDYGDRADWDHMDQWTVDTIRDRGWGVVMVPADEDGPGFAYTIGLFHTHRVPELVMFGLDVTVMQTLLNSLGDLIAVGERFVADEEREGVIERYPLAFRDVDLGWYRTFFGRAIEYYRQPPFPILQVFWPDRGGNFLWQDDSDERHRDSQPRLWLTPEKHPTGIWTASVI